VTGVSLFLVAVKETNQTKRDLTKVGLIGTRDQQHQQLILQSQERLVAFLDAELRLGFTFVDFAQAERDLGNLEHFQHARRDAEVAVQSIRHFLPRVEKEDARVARAVQCEQLEQVLADL
jgi:hypothetical protein